jgi:AsmA protein
MLIILWILGALLALVVLAAVLLPIFIDEQALTELAAEQVRTNTGGELVINGETDISFFPRFGLRLEGVELDLPAQTEYDVAIAASVDEVEVGLSLLPLLSGNVDVGTIIIAGITADITEPQALPPAPEPMPSMSDREWEQRGKLIRRTKAQERQRQLDEGGRFSGIGILAEAIRIDDVTVRIRSWEGDLTNHIVVKTLSLADVNTQDEPMRLDGAVTVLGDGSAVPLEITLDGSIRLASDLSRLQLDQLQTTVEGALTEPVTNTLSGNFTMTPAKADFAIDARLPGGDVSGQLVWSPLESPEIKLDITTERLDVDQIHPATSAQTSAIASDAASNETATAPKPVAGSTSVPAPLPVGPLRDLDLALRVAADHLIVSGQSIKTAQVSMVVRDGVTDIDYVRGVLHEGQLDTRITLNARRPIVEADIKGGLKGVNMDSLLASMGNTDAATGRIELAWDLDTEGASSNDLLTGLNGDLSAEGQDLVFNKIAVQGLVCTAVAAVNKIPPISGLPTNTPISELRMALDFDDGAGDIEALRFSTPGVVMKGSGDIALDTLDYRFRLEGQVNNDIMEVSPQCVIDQRYAGVDWPVDCQGNLSSESGPACQIDIASVAEQILKNEAQQQFQEVIEEKAGAFMKKLFGD